MDVRILTNFGVFQGQNGKALVYVGKTAGGTYMAALKQRTGDGTTESPYVDVWAYLRKSQIEAYMGTGDAQIATDFNLAILTDVAEPEFTTGENPLRLETVTNGADLPRLYNGELPYTVKGEGVTATEIGNVRTGTGVVTTTGGATTGTTTNAAAGSVGGIIPSDFSTLFSNPVKFVQDNPMFVVLVLAVVYFVRRKKKKPLWIF